MQTLDLLERARRVIRLEAEAVARLESTITPAFLDVIDRLLQVRGRVVTSGVGKAGLIARKAAATLASTGSPAFFVHPGEAVHGDLGMITDEDIVVAFSHRGQSEEVLRIIPYLKRFGTPIVAITSNPDSELAAAADYCLLIDVKEEACPLNLAPTSSTTAMLALADTIALVLLEARGFRSEDYAMRHPGGSLGRRLLTTVRDLMHQGADNPVVTISATLREAILTMTSSKLAATSVVDADGHLVGFFTDGDLRRTLLRGTPNLDEDIGQLMTVNPKFVRPDELAASALEVLRKHKIIELPVCDDEHRPIGMIHLHDIARAGIV